MQNIIKNQLKVIIIILVSLGILSCSEDYINMNHIDETIFVRHKNADMPAYIHGNGSDKTFLIILHGGPGGNGLWYRLNTIRTEIEENNAVVYFDQRGHNNSQGNYSASDISIDVMAEDVLALAKVIKYKYGDDSKIFLMGHSWGGTLSVATLSKDQSIFSGWIDVDGAHNLKGLYNENKISLTKTANEQIALGNSIDHWNSVINIVQNSGSENTFEDSGILNGTAMESEIILIQDQIINDVKADYGNNVSIDNIQITGWSTNKIRDILVNQQNVFQNVSLTDKLSKITIPSMVLWGKYDLVVPTVFAEEAFDKISSTDKELFIFEKSGHDPMLSEPDYFADKIIDFINKHK